jgi:hypothetical protein
LRGVAAPRNGLRLTPKSAPSLEKLGVTLKTADRSAVAALQQTRNALATVFADCRASAWVRNVRKDPRIAEVEQARSPLPSARRGLCAAVAAVSAAC